MAAEGDAFDPLQGAPLDPQSAGGPAALPASGPAQQLAGEIGGIEGMYALVENFPAIIMLANAELELVFANRSAREMLPPRSGSSARASRRARCPSST